MKLTYQDAHQLAAALIAFDGHQEKDSGKVVDRIVLADWKTALAMARNRRALTAILQDLEQARRDIIANASHGSLEIKSDDPNAAKAQADLAALSREVIEVELATIKESELSDTPENRKSSQALLAWLLPILAA